MQTANNRGCDITLDLHSTDTRHFNCKTKMRILNTTGHTVLDAPEENRQADVGTVGAMLYQGSCPYHPGAKSEKTMQ